MARTPDTYGMAKAPGVGILLSRHQTAANAHKARAPLMPAMPRNRVNNSGSLAQWAAGSNRVSAVASSNALPASRRTRVRAGLGGRAEACVVSK